MPPHLAGLVKRLPQGRGGERTDTGEEPDLKQYAENSFAQLIPHIVLNSGWSQENVIDSQQEQ